MSGQSVVLMVILALYLASGIWLAASKNSKSLTVQSAIVLLAMTVLFVSATFLVWSVAFLGGNNE